MKNYKRLTERRGGLIIDNCGICPNVNNKQGCTDKKCYEIMKNRLANLEDKIESGELCERKETAMEILILLGKGFDETARKDFKDLQWYKQFCRELELRYGIELFGKTEQVENFDKLEDEE